MALTVNKNALVVKAPSGSATTIFTTPVPKRSTVGVMVMVRSASVPPRTMVAFGTKDGSEKETKTVKSPGADSASEIVNGTVKIEPDPSITWAAIVEMAGASLTGSTSSSKLAL